MLSVFLISLLILVYTLQSFFCKLYSDSYPGDASRATDVFNIVSGTLVGIMTLCISGFSFIPSWQTYILGILCSVTLICYNAFLIKASQSGPYSILMIFSLAGGIIVPAVSSVIRGGEVSAVKWLSIIVIIIAVKLVSHGKNDGKIQTRAFIPLCVGLFFANGMYGTLFDIQQQLTGADEKEEMIILTYSIMAAFSFVLSAVKRGKKLSSDFKQTKSSALFLILCSFIITAAINLLVYILPLVNVTVLYTFDNAGVFLLSVLCSCVFFGEKLSLTNSAGCILMCAGLISMALS